MRSSKFLLPVLVTLASLVIVPGAHAATATLTADSLTYDAGVGEANGLTISDAAGVYTLDDPGVTITPIGCVAVDVDTVTCTSSTINRIVVNLGDLDDQVDDGASAAGTRALVYGGDGNDSILLDQYGWRAFGEAGDDTFTSRGISNGAAGADTFNQVSTAVVDYTERTAPVAVSPDGIANDGEAGEGDNIATNVNTFALGAGNDTYNGTGGNATADTVRGGDGDDTLTSPVPGSNLYGQGGNDTIMGGVGDDDVYGGEGADTLAGGGGTDTIDYASYEDGVVVDLNGLADDGTPGEGDNVAADFEVVLGGSGGDRLVAAAGIAITINGGSGNDTLTGNTADDVLDGDAGADTISGGLGNDTLTGDLDNDSLSGGDGNDTLNGNGGNDALAGNNGDDVLNASTENDTLSGGAGDDTLDGGAGIDVLDGGLGADAQTGGTELDTVTYATRIAAVRIIDDGLALDGELLEFDSLATVEKFIGGAGGDVLQGGDARNTLIGGAGADTLRGGAGGDVLDGGLGPDQLYGGTGVDTATWATRSTTVKVDLDNVADDGATGEADNARPDIENLTGGAGSDSLTGSAGVNVLVGNGGNDTLKPQAGLDTVNGGSGNDTVFARDTVRDVVNCSTGSADRLQRDPSDTRTGCEILF